MNLEIGYEFNRNGKRYCLVDFLSLDSNRYALFSIEAPNEKVNYEFCEMTENENGFHFKEVTDTVTYCLLLQQYERSNNGGE